MRSEVGSSFDKIKIKKYLWKKKNECFFTFIKKEIRPLWSIQSCLVIVFKFTAIQGFVMLSLKVEKNLKFKIWEVLV